MIIVENDKWLKLREKIIIRFNRKFIIIDKGKLIIIN